MTSPRMRAWQERRLVSRKQKRDKILDAALVMIGRQGVHGFSLQALCEEIGFSAAAIYKYVPSRDALIVEAQERALLQIRDALAARIDNHEAICSKRRVLKAVRPLASLLLTAYDWAQLSTDLPAHLALITGSLVHPHDSVELSEARRLAPALAATLALVESQLDAAAKAHQIREGQSRRRAGVFFAAVHGATQTIKFQRIDPEAFSLRAVVDVASSLLLAMGASSESLRAAARALPREALPSAL